MWKTFTFQSNPKCQVLYFRTSLFKSELVGSCFQHWFDWNLRKFELPLPILHSLLYISTVSCSMHSATVLGGIKRSSCPRASITKLILYLSCSLRILYLPTRKESWQKNQSLHLISSEFVAVKIFSNASLEARLNTKEQTKRISFLI